MQYIANHHKYDPAKRGKALNNSSLTIVFCELALIHQSGGGGASTKEDKKHIFAYICENFYQLFKHESSVTATKRKDPACHRR